jgi:hypothetical protein
MAWPALAVGAARFSSCFSCGLSSFRSVKKRQGRRGAALPKLAGKNGLEKESRRGVDQGKTIGLRRADVVEFAGFLILRVAGACRFALEGASPSTYALTRRFGAVFLTVTLDRASPAEYFHRVSPMKIFK